MSSPEPGAGTSVAVVVVNFNSAELLERCLGCLSGQTRPPDDIIVVDNNSTEEKSLSYLASLEGATVIKLDENPGYGAAINKAVATINDADLVCCLNPDAFPRPEWLATLLRTAKANPQFGSFASLMLKANDIDVIDGAGDVLHISGIPWRRFHGQPLSETNMETGPVFSACGGAAMYRLDAFREVGGFDESLFMYVEDVDLGFRLQLAGYPCLFVPGAVVEHVGSAVTGEGSDFSNFHGHRNLVFTYFKNMPLPLLLITLPLHVAANLWSILVFALRGSTSVILRAKWHALRRLPAALMVRRSQHQKVSSVHIWHLLHKLPHR